MLQEGSGVFCAKQSANFRGALRLRLLTAQRKTRQNRRCNRFCIAKVINVNKIKAARGQARTASFAVVCTNLHSQVIAYKLTSSPEVLNSTIHQLLAQKHQLPASNNGCGSTLFRAIKNSAPTLSYQS
jgi:hypothetical protein